MHEHPTGATSSTEPCLLQVLAMKGVRRIRSDHRQHGQDFELSNPIKKPIGFTPNADHLLEVLDRGCFGRKGLCSQPGGGKHQKCLGKTARRADILSDQMCETIPQGDQLAAQERQAPIDP